MTRCTAYDVFDESGDAGRNLRSSRHLVVAAIVCDNLEPLRKSVMRVRRSLPKSLRGKAEVRAFETPEAARPMLASLADMNARIHTVVLDKSSLSERDPAAVITLAYAACTGAALQTEGGIIATIDRPFTNERQRQQLVMAMADVAEEMQKRLIVVMEDSKHERALQVADVVAWAVFQKVEQGNDEFYEIVRRVIASETTLP